MFKDHTKPTLRFTLGFSNQGIIACTCDYAVPEKSWVAVQGRSKLLPLAAVAIAYQLVAPKDGAFTHIEIVKEVEGLDADLVRSAFNLLRNADQTERIHAGEDLRQIRGVLPRERGKEKRIEFDPTVIPPGNISFCVTMGGRSLDISDEGQLRLLLEVVHHRISASEFLEAAAVNGEIVRRFRFGAHLTQTIVVHHFPSGLIEHNVHCAIDNTQYILPDPITALVDRAYSNYFSNTKSSTCVKDKMQLAPKTVKFDFYNDDHFEIDRGGGNLNGQQLKLQFTKASYRFYCAFAYAEWLAEQDRIYLPLVDLARDVPNVFQPSLATCSMGVRVVVESGDKKFIVAYRSGRVNMNPNVWSVSANEGVREGLLRAHNSPDRLLFVAAQQAVRNELRLEREHCREFKLLSLYRNAFNQWGATFSVCCDLSSEEILARQFAADHAFEHSSLAVLPTDPDSIGPAMLRLKGGKRWYAGALESLCSTLSHRELGAGRFVSPEQIGARISHSVAHTIIPTDTTNEVQMDHAEQ